MESATSAGNKYTADEAMMGTHYSNNPSDQGANTMAMTKQQFIEYQRLKQQINKNIKKNSTQNFYLSDSPDAHRTINRRVQSITDEIAKQRQYLPQFDSKQNRQGQSTGPRKGDNGTPQYTPDNRGQRNTGLSYNKNVNGQFISPEPNFGGNLATNKFNENLELFQNQQNLQSSLIDRAGRVKNITSYKNEVQDVFNKQQVAQTRKKMIHMMENMPSTIGIFNNTGNNRPEIPFMTESYKGGSRSFKKNEKRLQSSFSRHDSHPKYQTMSKGASKISQYQRIHEFAKNYQRSIKKTRRNINNAYFDHIADEMSYNLNQTPMGGASNEALPPNLDYDMFDKPYGRKNKKNMSKTPVRAAKKNQKDQWPLIMDDNKMGFSQEEYGPSKYKSKKLKSPMKGDISPRQAQGPAVGYVNYVNGIPVEGSPDYMKAKKVTLPKGQKLPKLKQSPRREYYEDGNASYSAAESKEHSRKGQVRKSGKYSSNVRQRSPIKDASKERQRMVQQYDKKAKDRDGKHVSVSTSPLQGQSQQINIILPKRDAKDLRQVTPNKFQHATMQDRGTGGSVHSGDNSQGILKNRSAQRRAPGTANNTQTQTINKSVGRDSARHQSLGSRSPQSKSKRSKSKKKGYQGSGPLPQKTLEKEPPTYIVKDQTHFKKQDTKAGILDLNINQEDYHHLLDDDMDMISRHEVVYKILKDQLRQHQKELIKMKEEQKINKLENKITGKKRQPKPIDLSKFARHIKHFELYGPQRGVAPEIKRIIKNLTCQEHHFMYCPSCKQYEAKDFDPIQNIQKFMDYVKKEQDKLKKYNRAQGKRQSAHGVIRPKSPEGLVEDSVSEITDLDEQEILHKYISANMTEKERKKRERQITQKRLYGDEGYQHKHICSTTHKHRPRSQKAPKKGPTVRVQLKEASDGVSMQDEENSAHQFSLHNKSMQADSEERLEAEMQTSAIVYKSKIDQTSIQDHKSMNIQTSEIEYKSNNMQTNLYPEGYNRCEMACQTDPKMTKPRTPVKRSQKLQTEKPRAACDMYKEDWVHSYIFKKAVKDEAMKRGLPFEEIEDDDDEDFAAVTDMQSSVGRTNSDYYNTQPGRNRLASMIMTGGNQSEEEVQANGQEAEGDETDNTAGREQAMHMSAIGFMKRFQEKGDIKMLTESEIRYIKKLLKEKNLQFWTERSTLVDLHRHTKYTIRKVTSHMANIDNYQIFKRLKDPTREHTLYLVYRAERLFSAEAEAEKIFKLVAVTLFDAEQFQRIMDEKSIKKEDQVFVDKRSILFNRIMSLMNNFLEVYRLFNNKMTFKGQPLRDYIVSEHERIQQCIEQIEAEKLANPEAAAIEDAKDLGRIRKNRTGYFARSFLNSPDKTAKANPLATGSMAGESTPAEVNNRYGQEESKEPDSAVKPSDGGDDLNDRRSGDDQSPEAKEAQEKEKESKKGKEKRKPGPSVPAHIMEEDPYEEREKRFLEEQKEQQQEQAENKDHEQDNNVGLQTIEAINQEVDEAHGEDKGLEGARGRSMAGLRPAAGSVEADQMEFGVDNAPQTINGDDFKLQTQTVWNKNYLQVDQDGSHQGNLTQAQQSAEHNQEQKSNSKTVAMNHDNVINPAHLNTPLSQGTFETKDQGDNSQAVKQDGQNRPGTTETQAHVTPRLPGYDQEIIEEKRFEDTEGNDAAQDMQILPESEANEQREVTQGGQEDE